MDQKRLLKTIDAIASGYYKTDEELLESVVEELVKSSKFDVTGGRIWKLSHSKKAYKLLFRQEMFKRFRMNSYYPLKNIRSSMLSRIREQFLPMNLIKPLLQKGFSAILLPVLERK